MKIKIFLGYRDPTSGEYENVRDIEDMSKEEAKEYINKIQEQMANTIGYEKRS